jgi:type VI protein secretion system component VasK
MTTSTIVWIIVAAVAALLLIAGLVWPARRKRHRHRHMEAGNIRDAAEEETLHVRQHEALVDGTAANARRPDRSRRLGGPGVRSATASRRPPRRGSHVA